MHVPHVFDRWILRNRSDWASSTAQRLRRRARGASRRGLAAGFFAPPVTTNGQPHAILALIATCLPPPLRPSPGTPAARCRRAAIACHTRELRVSIA